MHLNLFIDTLSDHPERTLATFFSGCVDWSCGVSFLVVLTYRKKITEKSKQAKKVLKKKMTEKRKQAKNSKKDGKR